MHNYINYAGQYNIRFSDEQARNSSYNSSYPTARLNPNGNQYRNFSVPLSQGEICQTYFHVHVHAVTVVIFMKFPKVYIYAGACMHVFQNPRTF